jgi:SAM-dependent methyltransferase
LRIPDIGYVPNKHRFLMKLAEGRRVLHIGCADALVEVEEKAQEGRFLHTKLAQTARELWGCDIDAKGLDRLRELFGMEHLVLADAQNLQLEDVGGQPFEMAIAAEVIEHLTNPGSLLEGVRRILARGGLFCITTPNGALSLKTFLHSLRAQEEVAPEHVVLFSFTSLTTLFERFGFREPTWFSALERYSTRRNRLGNLVIEPIVRRFPQYADCLMPVTSLR